MATVPSVPVLLFKMRCMFFFTVKTCVLSQKKVLFPFFPLLSVTIDSAISFRTLWTIFWLAKTSNKPISLPIWLAVNPYLV